MTYNATQGAQSISKPYRNSMPKVSDEIEAEGQRGDFIGLFGRQADQSLMDIFHSHWDDQQQGPKDDKFRLKEFNLPSGLNMKYPNFTEWNANTNFLRSDHVRFWMANSEDYFASIKAIHITDTGPARGIMERCYHNECDTASFNMTEGFANLEFLTKVTQSMIDTLIDVSNAKCHSTKRIIKRTPTISSSYGFFDKKKAAVVVGEDPYALNEQTVKPVIVEPVQILEVLPRTYEETPIPVKTKPKQYSTNSHQGPGLTQPTMISNQAGVFHHHQTFAKYLIPYYIHQFHIRNVVVPPYVHRIYHF
jgi:hypothetical protein